MKFILSLLAFFSLLTSSPSQGTISDIITTPGNIQYGESCGDSKILFWMNAPRRNEWLRALVHIGNLDGAAVIGLGFIKANVIIGYSHNEPCWLLTSPSWFLPIPLSRGQGYKHLFLVPDDVALKGLPLFAQALHLDAVTNEVTMSRGIQMSVM